MPTHTFLTPCFFFFFFCYDGEPPKANPGPVQGFPSHGSGKTRFCRGHGPKELFILKGMPPSQRPSPLEPIPWGSFHACWARVGPYRLQSSSMLVLFR